MKTVSNKPIVTRQPTLVERYYLPGLLSILVISILFSLGHGSVNISFKQMLDMVSAEGENTGLNKEIILNIRLPRALLGALTGGALALCGVVMQAVARNHLADPYLMGVSSGASLGATVYILLWGGALGFGLTGCAFIGSLFSVSMVLGLTVYTHISVHRLILAGLAVNVLCASLMGLIIYSSQDPQKLQMLIFWQMGSLVPSSWDIFKWPAVVVMGGTLALWTQWKNLNLIMLDNDEACSLGINPRLYRCLYMFSTALIASSVVAHFGVIGFVGLIVPHLVRFFTGGNHRYLVPVATMAGAIFMVWVDMAARTWSSSEIPIGIITGLLGSPFFFWLLLRPERR